MSNHIYVPTYKTPGLHFGSQSKFERLVGSYFEEENFGDDNCMYKSIITSIIYKPDIIYSSTDGYGGRCWIADIVESKETEKNLYHFRNFSDLVKLFQEKGYNFIEKEAEINESNKNN